MAEIDPSYGVGWPYYSQTGSFFSPVSPPALGPFEGTLVALPCVNYDWLRLLLGASDQLRNPSSWKDLTPSQTVVVLSQVEQLQAELSRAGTCVICPQMRLQDCVLQFSCDGGATWTDVSGWAANFADCVNAAVILPPAPQLRLTDGGTLQQSIDGGTTWVDVTGWTENFCPSTLNCITPPVPPNPGDKSPNDRGCDIAGYLAQLMIDDVITKAVANFNDNLTLLQFGLSIFDTIAFAFPLTAIAADVFYAFYLEINAMNISDFGSASTDPVLRGLLTCAIYEAIKTTGYITAGNLATVISNVCAISYTHADVITALCGFITNIGIKNLQAMQVVGALNAITCEACGGGWCYNNDFRAQMGPYTLFNPSGESGHWVSGTGVVGDNMFGGWFATVQLTFPSQNLTHAAMFFTDGSIPDASNTFIQLNLGGSMVTRIPTTNGTYQDLSAFTCDEIIFQVGAIISGTTCVLLDSIVSSPTGTSPAGFSNC